VAVGGRVVVIALVLLLAGMAGRPFVAGLLITSQIQTSQSINGTSFSSYDVTGFEASDTDFDVTQHFQFQPQGGGSPISESLLFESVLSPYLVEYQALLFEDMDSLVVEADATRDTGQMAAMDPVGLSYAPSPVTGRQLLQAVTGGALNCNDGSGHDCTTTGLYSFADAEIKVRNPLGGVPESTLNLAACVGPIPPASTQSPSFLGRTVSFGDGAGTFYTDQSCYNSVGQARYSAVLAYGNETTAAQAAFVAAFTSFEQNQTLLFGDLVGEFANVQTYQTTLQTQIGIVTSQQTIINGTITQATALFAAAIANQTNAIYSAQISEANNTNTLLALANLAQTDETVVTAQLYNSSALASAAITSLSTQIAESNEVITAMNQNALQDFTQFRTLFQRLYSGEDFIDRWSISMHRLLSTPSSVTGPITGLPLTPFTSETGQAPAPNPLDLGPEWSTIPIGTQRLRVPVTMGAGQLYGVESWWYPSCGTVFFAENAPATPTGFQILGLYGPPGCDSTYTSNVTLQARCLCFNKLVETRCALASMNDALAWRSTDVIGSTAYCQTTPVPFAGGSNGTILDSSLAWADALAAITARGVAAPDQLYRAIDVYDSAVSFVPYASALLVPSQIMLLFQNYATGGVPGQNLAYWFNRIMQYSWSIAYANAQVYRTQLMGTPPNDMTQRRILYDRLLEGEIGPGWRATLIAVSQTSLLTLSLLLPSAPVAQVVYSVAGQAPVTLDASSSIVNNNQKLLPGVSGWIWDPERFATTLWAVPDDGLLQLVPYVVAAENTPLYMTFASDANTTFAAWNEDAGGGQTFDHEAAGHSPTLYAHTLDSTPGSPTEGMCVDGVRVFDGLDCLVRQRFRASISGTSWNDPAVVNTLTFTHLIGVTVSVTITTPVGVLSEDVVAACPTARSLGNENNQLVVLITNPSGPTTPPISFTIVEIGACPFTSDPQTVEPGGQITFSASACLRAPPGTPDQITFTYETPSGPQTCPTTIPLVYTSQTLTQFEGAVAYGYTNAIARSRVEGALSGQQQAAVTIADQLFLMGSALLSIPVETGFAVPTTVLANAQTLVDTVTASNAAAAAAAAALRAAVSADIAAINANAEAELAVLEAEAAVIQQELRDELDSLVAENQESVALLDNVRQLAQTDNTALGNELYFNSEFNDALVSAINDTKQQIGPVELDSGTTDVDAIVSSANDILGNTEAAGESGVNLGLDLIQDPLTLAGDLFSGSSGTNMPAIAGTIMGVVVLILLAIFGYWMVNCCVSRSHPNYPGDAAEAAAISREYADVLAAPPPVSPVPTSDRASPPGASPILTSS